ncbi:MAG: cation:proton antiporter [Rhodobiaceae bacterium]|nr:cation:proton antiporter [Rhodobiaceae bacterium]
MFTAATMAVSVTMALILIRAFLGPTVYDRILAVNAFGTVTVLIIGLIGFLTERPEFLDIALLYALINFVGTIAILKFFRYRALGRTSETNGSANNGSATE